MQLLVTSQFEKNTLKYHKKRATIFNKQTEIMRLIKMILFCISFQGNNLCYAFYGFN